MDYISNDKTRRRRKYVWNPFWYKKQNKLGHDTGSVSYPFDNPGTYSHTPKDRTQTADPGRLSRNQTK